MQLSKLQSFKRKKFREIEFVQEGNVLDILTQFIHSMTFIYHLLFQNVCLLYSLISSYSTYTKRSEESKLSSNIILIGEFF